MKYLILVLLLLLNGCVKENCENEKIKSSLNSHFQIFSGNRPIILAGDTQTTSDWEFWRENNDGIRKKIFAQIAEQNPGCFILLGDAVFDGSSKSEWDFFDEDILPIRKKGIPVYSVLGNHEYFGDNKTALNNYFSEYREIKKSKYYSLTYGKNAFLMLNSNFDEMSKSDISMQNRWFKETLEKFNLDETIKSVFVITHHPPFTNSKAVSENKDVQKYFLDSYFSSPKTKMFFSGHCHSFEHFIKAGKHFIVSGGGGGPRQEVETDPEKMKFKDEFKGTKIRPFHYCRLVNLDKDAYLEMDLLDEKSGEWKAGYKIML
ncbi:MAG: hypothetical protein GXX85_10075 [Ignavibacteria bacterium]|nr:hypothetical protein [Ignavibacteria bacterium]